MAGVHIFAARRLIDAERPRTALHHFTDAWRYSPAAVAKVWFKVAQALGGAAGMEGVFLTYRQTRRAVKHRGRKIAVDARGVHLG